MSSVSLLVGGCEGVEGEDVVGDWVTGLEELAGVTTAAAAGVATIESLEIRRSSCTTPSRWK